MISNNTNLNLSFLNIVTKSVKFDPVAINCLGIILQFYFASHTEVKLVGWGGG